MTRRMLNLSVHMPLDLTQLEFLRGPAAADLLGMALPDDPLAAQKVLRSRCERGQATAVATLRRLRTRAIGKFPDRLAKELLATDTLLQQASSLRLGVYVGRRLKALAERAGGAAPAWDLCCGLGADGIGLAMAGLDVCMVDLAAEAVLCAEHNAAAAGVGQQCRTLADDVTQLTLPGDAVVHVDPDRRGRGRRSVSLTDCRPDEAFLRRLVEETRAGAIKLSPMIGADEVRGWPDVGVEYVSEDGVCKQMIVWWPGRPAAEAVGEGGGRRWATVVWGAADDPRSVTVFGGLAAVAVREEPGEWLIEPDAAVIAAHAVDDLAAAEGLWRIEPGLVWLFGDRPVRSPLARSFRVLRVVPGREKTVRRAVAELGGGVVEVKPRGVKMDTDAMQRRLRGRGERRLVVLWGRVGRAQRAFLAEAAGERP